MKEIVRAEKWVEEFVIGYNLCPFAHAPYNAGRVRFASTDETDVTKILEVFWAEVEFLSSVDPSETSNSILVVPALTDSFEHYLDVFDMACSLLETQGMDERFQLASFHPKYQFEGTDIVDPANFTNRSPDPLLHILRVDEVASAIESHPDIDSIPTRNQEKMRELGSDFLEKLHSSAFR